MNAWKIVRFCNRCNGRGCADCLGEGTIYCTSVATVLGEIALVAALIVSATVLIAVLT